VLVILGTVLFFPAFIHVLYVNWQNKSWRFFKKNQAEEQEAVPGETEIKT